MERGLEQSTAPGSAGATTAPGRRPVEPRAGPRGERRFGHDFGQVRVFANQESKATPSPPGATPAPAQPADASCAHPGELRKVDLQPVALRTGAGDKTPTGGSWTRRFLEAARIWSKLGVYFRGLAMVTVDTPLKTTGSTDAEVFKISKLHRGTGIEVFFADNDLKSSGGGAIFDVGAPGKVVLSDRGTSDTLLAHEIGHVLGLGHPPADADEDTVMKPSASHSTAHPTRNTKGNYDSITWPASSGPTCLNPDP